MYILVNIENKNVKRKYLNCRNNNIVESRKDTTYKKSRALLTISILIIRFTISNLLYYIMMKK